MKIIDLTEAYPNRVDDPHVIIEYEQLNYHLFEHYNCYSRFC